MTHPNLERRSAALSARAWRVLPNGNSRSTVNRKPHPIYVAEASGAEIVDVDGNRYVDFNNNMTSLIHGNAYPPVMEAVTRQLAKGTGFSMATEVEIELAELLCERVPSFERVRFCNSGSEAVMNLIKASRAFTGRPKVAKVEGFYHGSYDFAEVGLTTGPNDRRDGEPIAKPTCYGTPQSVLDEVVLLPFNDTAIMQRLIERHADELACVLIDPMPLALGMATFEAGYLAALKRLTQQHGILLCLDEVVSLRLGYRGAQGAMSIDPDLTAIAKTIGGGFPVGALAGRAEVMSVFEEGEAGGVRMAHGGTFNANPVTMTAGLVAMTDMDEERFRALNSLGEQLRQRLRTLLAELDVKAQVVGEGSFFSVHFHQRHIRRLDDIVGTPEEHRRSRFMRDFLFKEGMWLLGAGVGGCLSTATTHTHVDQLCDAMRAGLTADGFPAQAEPDPASATRTETA